MVLDSPRCGDEESSSTVVFAVKNTADDQHQQRERQEGPCLLASHQHGGAMKASPAVRYDLDDSLDVVFSADTGAGRAHTPQRANRSNTPQRPRSSSLLNTAPAPVQLSSGASRGGGDARCQRLGRRKQRRWDNDNLVGVEKLLRGRHACEEGEADHLTVSVSRRSSLSSLMSDKNGSANVTYLRNSIRMGLQPKTSGGGSGGVASCRQSRNFAGGKWEDAEERFLLVERRLRDIVVRALRNSTVLSFVVGLETLLEAFVREQKALAPADFPAALASSFTAHPTVEVACDDGGTGSKSKDKAKAMLEALSLSVPLGPSPFHRLLLHALCQYWRLRSKSQETPNGRIVQVTIPPSRGQQAAPPSASLSHFVLETRLKHPTGGVGGDSITSGLSGMGPSVPGTRGGDSRCGGRQVWPLEPGEHERTPAKAVGVTS